MAQDPDRWVVTPPPNRAQAPSAARAPTAQQPAPPADDRWVVTPPPNRAPPRARTNAPARGRQVPAAPQDAPLPDEPVYAPTPNLPQTQEKREVTLPDGRRIVVVGEGAPLDSVAGGVLPDDYVEGDRVWRATPPAAGAAAPLPMDQGQENIAAAINVLPGPARRLVGGYAGAARGLARVGGGAYGLLGQAADRLGLDGIGNAMIDQANAFQGGADRLNAPFRNAALRENQIGQVAGEVAATAPLTAGVGAGVGAVGRGVAAVAPRTGGVISRVGQSIGAGGFTPSAVGRPAAGAVAPTLGARAGNLAVRGVGGATAGGVGAAVIDEDDATMGAAIGAALPTIAARPAKWALNRVLDTYQRMVGTLGEARAATIVRNALGIDLDRAVTALQNAAPDVTAQQALVDAGVEPAAFMAVGSAARAADPDAYLAIEAAQAAARQAPIDRLAGGSNLTAAQLAARGEKAALRAATVPMQQAELAAADASNALDVAPVVGQLMRMADAPGVGTTNARVLAEVASALDAMASRRGGVPSAEDIYAFRKDDLDDIITRALSVGRGGEVTSQAARRSEMVRATQDMLDSAIETAARRAPPASTVSAADTPLTLYHGSAADFDNFDLAFMGSGEGGQGRGLGFYFSTQPEVAKYYVDKMRAVGRAGPGVEYTVTVPQGKFIDWDIPIAQQPDVMAVAPSMVGQRWLNAHPEATAREFMQAVAQSGVNARLVGRRADQAAVAQLREQGFVGTVHSDALTQSPSLGGGQGQRNYAVFDPRDITIRAKNGVPTAAGAEPAVPTPRADGGWRRYLDAYASGMRGIERQQMMGVAGRQLRQSPNEFANLVGGENPSAVEGVFGPGRIDLNAMMNPTGVGPSGMDALTRAAREVRRDERVGVLAREGSARARELMGPQRDPLRRAKNIAAWSRPVTAVAMDFGAALMDANLPAQTKRALAQAYQSGANMDQLLRMVPLADRAQVWRNLRDPRLWLHLQGAAANTMASPDQPGNAMTATYTTPEELANSVPVEFPE